MHFNYRFIATNNQQRANPMTFSPNNSQSLTTWTKDYITIFNVSKKLAWRRAKQIRQKAKQLARNQTEVSWIS